MNNIPDSGVSGTAGVWVPFGNELRGLSIALECFFELQKGNHLGSTTVVFFWKNQGRSEPAPVLSSFFVFEDRTSLVVFTNECLSWLTNVFARKSTSEPNELNHNIWFTIDPCAQSSFAVPDYWKDLLLQSNTRHKPYIDQFLTDAAGKAHSKRGLLVQATFSVNKMSFCATWKGLARRLSFLFSFSLGACLSSMTFPRRQFIRHSASLASADSLVCFTSTSSGSSSKSRIA